jgi:hypothetical protein
MLPVMAVFSHDNLIAVMAPNMSLLGWCDRVHHRGDRDGSLLAYTEALFPRESRGCRSGSCRRWWRRTCWPMRRPPWPAAPWR